MRKNLAKWLPHRFSCDLAIGDLSIGCLGVHTVESLDVRVATNFVKMMKMKEVARNKSSIFLTHPLKFCSQCFIERSLPNSVVLRNKRIVSSLFLSKTCENFRSGSEICSCSHWFSLMILVVAHQRDGALVPVPLMLGCGVRDVDCREVVQVSAILFCPSMGLLRISVDGALLVFPCSSSGIHCFPMVLFPLSLSVLLAP